MIEAKLARSTGVALILAAALAASGCSNTASNLLSTGSILGGGDEKKVADEAAPATPQDRAIQVAAVSARAQKCGFVFDPAKLQQDYLAAEAAAGLPPEQLAGLTQVYGFTNARIAKTLAEQSDYCDEAKTAVIKADLNRHLTGDFTPRQERKVRAAGFFETDIPEGKEKLNPEWLRDNSQPKTVRVEE